MSDTQELDGDLDLDDLGSTGEQESKDIRQLRKKAKEADRLSNELTTAQQEALAAKRELAFVRAGIDLDSPTGKLAARAYDGDPTIEAVRAFAQEYGVLPPSTQDEEELDQQQALQRLSNATTGAVASSGGSRITADTYGSWDKPTRDAFRKNHPREFEALQRGESVPAIAGF